MTEARSIPDGGHDFGPHLAAPPASVRSLPLIEIASITVGLLLWELAARLFHFPFLPPLGEIFGRSLLLMGQSTVRGHLITSTLNLIAGFALAAVVGLPIGALMGRFRRIGYALDVYLDALLATPSLVYVPILFSLFGVGRTTQVAVVFLYSVFIITANTAAGVRNVDRTLLEMARSFGAGERQLMRRVTIPGALPLILAGLKIGASRGVKGMINGELFIALVGLGALIRRYGSRFDAEGVFAVLVFVAVIALLTAGIGSRVEARLTGWQRR